MLAHDPHSHGHKGKPINRYNEHMHIQEKFTKEEGVHAYVCMWRVARDKQMSPRACNLCEILLLPHVWYKIWRVSERERGWAMLFRLGFNDEELQLVVLEVCTDSTWQRAQMSMWMLTQKIYVYVNVYSKNLGEENIKVAFGTGKFTLP